MQQSVPKTSLLAAGIPRFNFITLLFGCLLKWPCPILLTFYQSLEVLAEFGHLMLWGIALVYLCKVDFTAGGTSFITDEQMDVRMRIFQSINYSLLCFSGPPWTWRAATATAQKITAADGVMLTDSDGNQILDGMAGLWCVNIGYGRKELADVAYAQMQQLPYYNTFFQTSHVPAISLSAKLPATVARKSSARRRSISVLAGTARNSTKRCGTN